MAKLLRQAPLPVALLIASFLCPTELSLYLGGMRLPPHRVVLLLLLPFALVRLAQRRDPRLRTFDWLFTAFAAWTVGVYMHHHGAGDGLQSGGALALESFASYLIARVYIRTADAFRATLAVLVACIALTGAIALPEAITGRHFVHDILREVTGYVHPIGDEKRLGLTRAYGTFDHPIHLGAFSASILAMVWMSTRKRSLRHRRSLVVAASAMLGLSSAPMLCLGLQGGLLAWHRVTRGIKGRIWLTLGFLAVAYMSASLVATRSPIAFVATGMTLDSWTGYYRLMIWESGLDNVWANPWAGLGLNDWVRPWWMVSSTVDAFWLVIAMRGGIPAFVLLAAAVSVLLHVVTRRARRLDRHDRRIAIGWTISLVALVLVACTVHFWNVLYAYFFFFLGLAGWIADPKRVKRHSKVRVAAGGSRSLPNAVSTPHPTVPPLLPPPLAARAPAHIHPQPYPHVAAPAGLVPRFAG